MGPKPVGVGGMRATSYVSAVRSGARNPSVARLGNGRARAVPEGQPPRLPWLAAHPEAVSLFEQRGQRERGGANNRGLFGNLGVGLVEVNVHSGGASIADQGRDISPPIGLQRQTCL